jgi:fumarate reductase flavoprotein subunit
MVNMDHTFETGPYGGAIADPANPNREIAHINMVKYPGAIWVSNEGKRVVREDIGGYLPALRDALAAAPDTMLNVILDSKMRASNKTILTPIFDTPERPWEWFDEKAAEGVIIKKAGTLDELAGKLNLPAAALSDTVNKWNAAINAGKDEEFGRLDLTMKLENPPYYGIATGTIAIGSSGGPAINCRQEVLRPSGKVIRGLYAAGEAAGYRAHGTGSFHTGNLVFGRQAGYQAAIHASGQRR